MIKEQEFYDIDNFLIDISAKCGSTKVLSIFLHDKKLKCGSDLQKGTYHNYIKSCNKVKTATNPNDKITIKFVRNPYTRIVSIFFHSLLFLKIDMSFFSFVTKLKDYYETGSSDMLFSNERTLEHYYFQVRKPLQFKYDHVIKLENINSGIENLNILYNLKLKCNDLSLNSRKKKDNVSNINYPYSNFSAYKNCIPTNYKLFYDDSIRLMVSEMFKEDIETFNYTFDELQ